MSILSRYYDLKTIQKVALLVALMSVFMIVIGLTGFYFNKKAQNSMISMYYDNAIPMSNLNLARTKTNGIKADLLELILTKDSQRQAYLLKDMKKRNADNNKIIADFEKNKPDSFETKNLLKYKDMNINWTNVQNKVVKLVKDNKREEAYNYLSNNITIPEAIQQTFRDLSDYNAKQGKELNAQNIKDGNTASIVVIVTIIVALILSVWFACFISLRIQALLDKLNQKLKAMANGDLTVEKFGYVSKSDVGELCASFDIMRDQMHTLIQQVLKSAEDIAASSEEMSASAEQTAQGSQQTATSTQQLAQGAQEISRNVEMGASNINKLNKTIQDVAQEAGIVAKLGNDTETNANIGAEHVKKAVLKIDSIKNVAGAISLNISELGKLSSEIEQIVDLIKNIAGQTNLLALNAAIEAARAGEHGKGFAVVADEVKKLAGQSAGATEKITAMIKEIQNKTHVAVNTMDKATKEVEEGVFVINDAGEALDNIISQVKQANNKIQGITGDIDGVAKSSEDLVQMIENISAITEETAASSEEISSITEEQTASLEEISASSQLLASIAETLNKQVSVFKI